jgi:predicted nucleic acid-binding protein
MKVYLDTCSLQRPLDNKSQIRITLEAEAVLGIIGLCEAGQLELVSSDVLVFEVRQNPQVTRREFGLEVLSKASSWVKLDKQIEERAKELNGFGLKPLDALHLASAEAIKADYFCTCDDKILRKTKAISSLNTKVLSPVELIEELNDDNRS